MSEIKFFRLESGRAVEIPTQSITVEKSLQSLIEQNSDTMLGVRFLRTEFTTGKSHSGRIDTLGIDENGLPVIIEYKRAVNENVINQGLFYLDWLMDHKADFKLLVMEKLGNAEADRIDWSGPRLICIAADYTRYDEYAVKQINRNIELMRYRRFGSDFLALELVHRTSTHEVLTDAENIGTKETKKPSDKEVNQSIAELDTPMRDLYEAVRSYLLALGEDVQEKQLKLYIAYRRIKNFCSLVIQKKQLTIYLKLNPDTVTIDNAYMRDVRQIGHWATGDLEVVIRNETDFQNAQPLIQRAYEGV